MKGVGQGIVGSWCSVQWDTIYGCNLNTGGGVVWIFYHRGKEKGRGFGVHGRATGW
jgi:hypothetical protein